MSEAGKHALEDRLSRTVEAYHEAALLYAAVKLGLAEKMSAGRWTPGALAEALGLSPPHLGRFLRGLCTIGLCEEEADGAFALTPVGQSLTHDSRLAAKIQIVVEQYWQPWAALPLTLQSGRPAFEQVFGISVSDWRHAHPEQGAMFASYLAKEMQVEIAAILASLDVSETGRVVEIDGADAFPAERPPEADLYLLNSVLQSCDDEAARTILKQCRTAMPDGARLVIIERLMPERAMDDPAAIMLDLHLMTIYGGRARTKAEMEALLADAGFASSKKTPTHSGLSIIEAVPT